MSLKADLQRLLAEVEKTPGWTVDKTEKGHHKITGPGGVLFYTAGTPSDWRSILAVRADLKRHGWPNGKEKPPMPSSDTKTSDSAPATIAKAVAPPPSKSTSEEQFKRFGELLRDARSKLGMVGHEFGVQFGCSGGHIHNLERAVVQPSRELYQQIVAALPALDILDAKLLREARKKSEPATIQAPPASPPPPKAPEPAPAPAASSQPPRTEVAKLNGTASLFRLGTLLADASRDDRTWKMIERVLEVSADAHISVETLRALMKEVQR